MRLFTGNFNSLGLFLLTLVIVNMNSSNHIVAKYVKEIDEIDFEQVKMFFSTLF